MKTFDKSNSALDLIFHRYFEHIFFILRSYHKVWQILIHPNLYLHYPEFTVSPDLYQFLPWDYHRVPIRSSKEQNKNLNLLKNSTRTRKHDIDDWGMQTSQLQKKFQVTITQCKFWAFSLKFGAAKARTSNLLNMKLL